MPLGSGVQADQGKPEAGKRCDFLGAHLDLIFCADFQRSPVASSGVPETKSELQQAHCSVHFHLNRRFFYLTFL